MDVVIFRENTEDVYAGIEYESGSEKNKKLAKFLREELGAKFFEGAGLGVKPISAHGTKRLVRKAIQHAIEYDRSSVTLVHKGNIMKFTEGAFRQWGYDVAKEEFGAHLAGRRAVDAASRTPRPASRSSSRIRSPTSCSSRCCCVPMNTRCWPPPT